MNRKLLLLCAAFLAITASAQEPDENASAPGNMMMQQMQGRMQMMQEQMESIHATNDPEERQRLMQEHMASMHANMQMMTSMMTQRMSAMEMQSCAEDDAQCRLNRIEGRQHAMNESMGMMQMMMEQMMQQLEVQENPSEEAHEEHH